MFKRIRLGVLGALILSTCAAAQYTSNRGVAGGNSVEVRFMIVLEGQKEPYTKQVTVTFYDGWGNVETGLDATGGFVDVMLNEGIHRLRAYGPEIEPYMDEFSLGRDGNTMRTLEVRPRRFPLGQKTEKTADATPVVRLNIPKDARKEFEKARDSWKQKKIDETRNHLRKAITLYPKYDEAFAALGELELSVGDKQQGAANLQSALALNGDNVPAARRLAQLDVDDGNYAAAEPLLRTVLRAEPANPWALSYAAWGELVLGKLPEAIANAQKVASLPHKGFEGSYLIAARGLEMSGRFAEARSACNSYLAELPDGKDAAEARKILQRLDNEAQVIKDH